MTENEKVAEKLDVLFQKVYLPVFIDKLASCGVKVDSEEELGDILKIAALTRAHASDVPAETPKSSVIKQAASSLEAMTVGNAGIIDSILQDPEIANVFQA